MLLHLSTWPEVERYLEQRRQIIIPIGSTEQHGPTGVIGTDCICPETIAVRAEQKCGVMVAPTFNVGVAQHHLAFAGTITLRPSTMAAVISDWVSSLARHGFETIYFLNGHGGNVAPAQAAFAEIHAERSLGEAPQTRDKELALLLRCWWDLPGVVELRQELYGKAEGSHATPAEIAVTQHAYAAAIRDASTLTPEIAPSGSALVDAETYRARFPDGRIGSNPALARPEDGQRLVEAASDAVVAELEQLR
ncbi:MAG: creatininase family protein [Myxococcales bacterium]|nr:creatininase family protein [Myxococcales bacterium]